VKKDLEIRNYDPNQLIKPKENLDYECKSSLNLLNIEKEKKKID